MRPGLAANLGWGLTVVAAILFFAAFVALFRRDLGDPYVASGVFAGTGAILSIIAFLLTRGRGRD
jgi:hypothetical protein